MTLTRRTGRFRPLADSTDAEWRSAGRGEVDAAVVDDDLHAQVAHVATVMGISPDGACPLRQR